MGDLQLDPSSSSIMGNNNNDSNDQGSHSEVTATMPKSDEHKEVNEGHHDHGSGDTRDDEATNVKVGDAPKKRKKKKSKPKSKRGHNAPTGFEEFYVDAPLTPAEFEEEKGLYDTERPFTERIQTVIQRYHAKRRMDALRKDIFDKYLSYGGVDMSPKMFQGMDTKAFEDMDAAEIMAATARAHVSSDKELIGSDGSKWVVDFEAVAKGFFSCRVPIMFDLATEDQVKFVTGTIYNFINYLLHHNVAPEYVDQIYAARRICVLAEKELWKISQVGRWLPGDFNMACSTLYGGYHKDTWSPNFRKILPDGEGLVGMSDKVAKQVVMFGIAAAGTEEQAVRFHELDQTDAVAVTGAYETGLEITEIHFADYETRLFYKEQSAEFRILGSMKAKPWHNPGLPEPDLTKEEEEEEKKKKKEKKEKNENENENEKQHASLVNHHLPTVMTGSNHVPRPPQQQQETTELEFYVEDATLRFLFVGMKFEATVRELNCGWKYFDTVIAVHPSFHTFLPNEMMLGWKNARVKTTTTTRRHEHGGGGDDDDDEEEEEEESDASVDDADADAGAGGENGITGEGARRMGGSPGTGLRGE